MQVIGSECRLKTEVDATVQTVHRRFDYETNFIAANLNQLSGFRSNLSKLFVLIHVPLHLATS